MIKYDYLLERNEKREIKTYIPHLIPRELPNLVYIEGPNSSGKSTLLHLLALSFHGLKSQSIIKPLHDKMDNLINGGHQHISFKIAITDKDGNTEFTAEKKDLKGTEITLRDANSNIMSDVNFFRKYRLIYDIPENPTGRLKDLTREIRDKQIEFSQNLGRLRTRLVHIIKDIRDARNPEKIKDVRADIVRITKEKDNNISERDNNKENLTAIKMYAYTKYYEHYKNKYNQLLHCVKDIEKEGAKKEKDKRKYSEEYHILHKELTEEKTKLKELYYDVTNVLKRLFGTDKKHSHRLGPWEKIVIENEILSPDINKTLVIDGKYFHDELVDIQQKEQKEKGMVFQEVQLYRELLKLLENFSKLTIKVPGIELTVEKFMKVLEDQVAKNDEIVAKKKVIDQTLEQIKDILNKREYVVNVLMPKLKKAAKASAAESETEKTEDKKYYEQKKQKEKCDDYKRSMEDYRDACIRINIPESEITKVYQSAVLGKSIKSLDTYGEDELKRKICSMENDIATLEESIRKGTSSLDYLTKEMANLEKRKPHEYQNQLSFLENDLLKKIQIMEHRMNTFDTYIKPLVLDEDISKKLSDDENSYYDEVFTYLAKRLGTIRHVDKEHKVKKVDLINKEITTQDDRVIKLLDMGTGQSQSAFLTSLLDTEGDKKIIALIDEVAMMDQKSLKPVFERMKNLYKNGRLLLGMIVQKAEEVCIKEIV